MSLIIFTGLDEMLLDERGLDYQSVQPVVNELKQNNIPLIPVTTKTRAEVEELRAKFQLMTPFVVEHGSGIFLPLDNPNFSCQGTNIVDNYHLHQLGCSYTEARAALKVVQEEINKILRGFGDLDEENIQSLINSSVSAARKAKTREFSEYFLTPSRLEIAQLQEVAQEYGFKIFPGAKLSLILGQGAEGDRAIQWLLENFQPDTNQQPQTIGLGFTEQDLAMLENVDIPIIIPTEQGVAPCFADKNWQIATSLGTRGWIESVTKICRS